jgi:hypothetical protein
LGLASKFCIFFVSPRGLIDVQDYVMRLSSAPSHNVIITQL